jgi:hypothetical protein
MHRAIAAWLTERPWRAAMVCALLGALAPQVMSPFAVAAGAIPVLIALRLDTLTALGVAASATVAGAWVLMSIGQSPAIIIAGATVLFMAPVGLAFIVRQTNSLNLAFQLAVLATAVALIGVHVALSDPTAVWLPILKAGQRSMQELGLHYTDEMILPLAKTMWGLLAVLTLVTVVSSLFLGRWWSSLLGTRGSFGAEFRELRLGVVLGVAISIVLPFAYWFESSLAGSLAWVAFGALSFQGLAAAHRGRARGNINRGWLAAIYVLLIVPLSTFITVIGLAVWGFVDNWRRPRTRAV